MAERANPAAKLLDYYLGIPMVLLLGALKFILSLLGRRKKFEAQRKLKIGFLKTSAIGDTVLLSALLPLLRKSLPDAELIFFSGGSNFTAAKIFFPGCKIEQLPIFSPLRAVSRLREFQLDILFDFDSWPRINALLSFFSGAGYTVGFKTRGQCRHFLYDEALSHSFELHELENYLSLLSVLKVKAEGELLPIDPRRISVGVAGAGLSVSDPSKRWPGSEPQVIIFHPWSGGSQARRKQWSNDNWALLARRVEELGYQVFVSGGPLDWSSTEALLALAPDLKWKRLETPSLAALIERLQESALLITVDTGVAHIAGACDVPVIVLHGPTSPKRWGSKGKRVHYIKDEQTPNIQLGFETAPSGKPQGLQLSADVVFEKAREVLKGVIS